MRPTRNFTKYFPEFLYKSLSLHTGSRATWVPVRRAIRFGPPLPLPRSGQASAGQQAAAVDGSKPFSAHAPNHAHPDHYIVCVFTYATTRSCTLFYLKGLRVQSRLIMASMFDYGSICAAGETGSDCPSKSANTSSTISAARSADTPCFACISARIALLDSSVPRIEVG